MSENSSTEQPSAEPADDAVHYYLRKFQRHPKYLATKKALRSIRQIVPNAWRLSTHRLRALPGAVIVGVAKAGTTQLYAYLLRHPRCFSGTEKEINYFSWHHHRPLGWYQARFPLARTVNAVRGVCMEASPSYLPSPDALRRMHDVLPAAKIIVIMRDPVARAFSQFQHNKQRHREPKSFEEIVRESIAHSPPIASHDQPLPPMPEAVSKYIWQGYYASQIAALWQLYPREQTLLLDAADLFDDTNAMCQRVLDFLGLERFDVQPDKVYNRGYYREKIEPATADLLREHYRPHDEWLVRLTGQTFRWMNEADASEQKSAA
jgi:hypothetical protein